MAGRARGVDLDTAGVDVSDGHVVLGTGGRGGSRRFHGKRRVEDVKLEEGAGDTPADPTDDPTAQDEQDLAEVDHLFEQLAAGNYGGEVEDFQGDLDALLESQNPDFDSRFPRHPIVMPDPSQWGECRDIGRVVPAGGPNKGDLANHLSEEENRELLRVVCGDPKSRSCPDLNYLAPAPISVIVADDNPFDNLLELGIGGLSSDPDREWERLLIQQALSVLLHHKDLIEWAACYVEGPSLWNDLHDRLTGRKRLVVVLQQSNVCDVGSSGFCSFFDPLWGFEPVIHISKRGDWRSYVEANEEDPLCGAVSLAGTLLHELWHIVRWGWFVDLGDNNCNPPVLLENLFRWALYQRCPQLVAPLSYGCCNSEYNALSDAVSLAPGVFVNNVVFPC